MAKIQRNKTIINILNKVIDLTANASHEAQVEFDKANANTPDNHGVIVINELHHVAQYLYNHNEPLKRFYIVSGHAIQIRLVKKARHYLWAYMQSYGDSDDLAYAQNIVQQARTCDSIGWGNIYYKARINSKSMHLPDCVIDDQALIKHLKQIKHHIILNTSN